MVSEAFLSFFVRMVGHFSQHVKHGSGGQPGVFQRKSFCKAVEHRANRPFVKNFIKTQMFDMFIQEVERQPAAQEGSCTVFFICMARSESRLTTLFS